MAKLYVTEYNTANTLQSIYGGIGSEPGTDQAPVTFSTTTQSAAFAPNTTLVRIHTDSICSIAFGANPSATTNNKRLNANTTEYFTVPQGQSYKVAAVTNT